MGFFLLLQLLLGMYHVTIITVFHYFIILLFLQALCAFEASRRLLPLVLADLMAFSRYIWIFFLTLSFTANNFDATKLMTRYRNPLVLHVQPFVRPNGPQMDGYNVFSQFFDVNELKDGKRTHRILIDIIRKFLNFLDNIVITPEIFHRPTTIQE